MEQIKNPAELQGVVVGKDENKENKSINKDDKQDQANFVAMQEAAHEFFQDEMEEDNLVR